MNTQILSLKNIYLTFGGKPLFANVELQVFKGDKISLVGRNGSGKSSLLKIIAGKYDFDKGERFILPSATTAYLEQANIIDTNYTIYDYLLAGKKNFKSPEDYIYKADIILTKLDLDGNEKISELSGGKLRRASLANTLIEESDILLLDEPTNHLDIKSIEWLETYIKNYSGALICISHDRQFLKNISNKVHWLDRGIVRTLNKSFEYFEEWTEELFEQEQNELQKLNKKLDAENLWLQQGVTARRKRNQGRLKDLFLTREKLKSDKGNFQKISLNVKLPEIDNNNSSKLILEITNAGYSYFGSDKQAISNFSLRIMKGEKIALIGKNGSGKSTLIKLITGDLKPISGTIKLGSNLKISYFDQKRESLDFNKTVFETICPYGGDTIQVGNQIKHINSYMKDFLFNQQQLNSPVSSLSGGEANRLLLAKILANPGNLLILDEPTNDLDMETLDILEESLSNYNGTLIIVSHDRDFLDRIVTRSLVFEESNKIVDFIGGYTDYIKQDSLYNKTVKKAEVYKKEIIKQPSNKLSYKYVRELELLPSKIENLGILIKSLEDRLNDPELYTKNIEEFNMLSKELENKKNELQLAENRWLELEEMNENL